VIDYVIVVFWQVEPFLNLFLEMLNLSSQQHKNVEFKIDVWEFWWPPNSNSFHQKRFNTSTINQVFVFYQLIPNTFISQSPFGNAAKTLLTLKNTYL